MVVTRFAPSPTGYLHIGGLRTALYSYLWARKNEGKFLLRIEDTDEARNSESAAQAIVDAFKWVGMEHDGEIVYQSNRKELYKKYINQLLEEGKAYKCYMSKEELDAIRAEQTANKERPRYLGQYRDFTGTPPEGVEPVIRIKAPTEGIITVDDGIKGSIDFPVKDMLDDFIIARADGTATYNFVVAIDDALMGVNNVIRGDDHLSNTPKQIVIYEALGFELPKFYHVAMINNPDGKKLSKRDGATDVMAYDTMGYRPEALLNFLVRLGWSHGDQEIFSKEEMLTLFNPKDINNSSSSFNQEKLEWLNAHYIKNMNNDALASALEPFGVMLVSHDKKEIVLDAIKERAKTLVSMADQIKEILESPTSYDEKAMKKGMKGNALEVLQHFRASLDSDKEFHLPTDYHNQMEATVTELEVGFGQIGQVLRVALLGKMSGPGLDTVMSIVGLDTTKARIDAFVSEVSE